jgi:hypothetical protein
VYDHHPQQQQQQQRQLAAAPTAQQHPDYKSSAIHKPPPVMSNSTAANDRLYDLQQPTTDSTGANNRGTVYRSGWFDGLTGNIMGQM